MAGSPDTVVAGRKASSVVSSPVSCFNVSIAKQENDIRSLGKEAGSDQLTEKLVLGT